MAIYLLAIDRFSVDFVYAVPSYILSSGGSITHVAAAEAESTCTQVTFTKFVLHYAPYS